MKNTTTIKASDLVQGLTYRLSRQYDETGKFIKVVGNVAYFSVNYKDIFGCGILQSQQTQLHRVKLHSHGLAAPFVIVDGRTLAVFNL